MILEYINFYKITDFIVDSISKSYEFLLKISYILNSDIRKDIFIGITGLMVAIVIRSEEHTSELQSRE